MGGGGAEFHFVSKFIKNIIEWQHHADYLHLASLIAFQTDKIYYWTLGLRIK